MQESARSLRTTLRHQHAEDAYLALFHSLAVDCTQQGWSPAVANRLLDSLCANIGASHGFIATQAVNTFEVVASMGESYPEAARIPMMGQLAKILKSPCSFDVHINAQAVTPNQTQATFTNYILPITFNQQPVGLLAFASAQPTLNSNQRQLCESICGLLGAIMRQTNTQQATQKDLSVIDVLTPREREVFALLPSGKSNAELGALLGIAGGTVKIHVERVLSKLGLKDRTQAAVKAVELGFSSSDSFK